MHPSDTSKAQGRYRAFSFSRDLTPVELQLIRRHSRGLPADLSRIPLVRSSGISNLIPTVGRNVLARRLAGNTTYTGIINYGALGSGTTPFTNASTQLTNEIFRLAPSDSTFDDNIAYIDWYIASGDVADQTFEEFGAFIDGTGSADSGQLFSAVITGGWEKSGSMFVSLMITLN